MLRRTDEGDGDGGGGENVIWKGLRVLWNFRGLFQLAHFVKCKRILLELKSKEQYSSSKREKGIRRRLFTFLMKREIEQVPVVIVQWRQRSLPKSVLRLQICCCCVFSNLIKLLFWRSRCHCFCHILSSLFLSLIIFFITIHWIIYYLCIVVCVAT